MNSILTNPWQGITWLPRKRVVFLLVWLASVGASAPAVADTHPFKRLSKHRLSRAELPVVGQVSNENGEGLPGISIVLKGSTNGTTTDVEGNFRINVPGEETVLVFSFIGYQSQEIRVGKRTELKVRMEPDTKQLSELVVVGYAVQERKNLIGSVAKVNPKETNVIPVASFDAQLQGKAAGVQINSQTGIPGDAVVVRVRGAASINASADPLYIVDGVFINNQSLSSVDLGGKATSPIADINPADIESIEVLKDASATAIYGSRGAAGVIIVTTKRGNYEQSPKVTFNTLQGVAWADKNRLWKPVTGPEHASLVNEAWVNSGKDNPALKQTYENRPFRPVEEVVKGVPGRGTPESQQTYDRLGDLFRTGRLQSYDLSLQGGSKSTRYYLGGSYAYQEANIRPALYERASFKINLDQKVSDKVTIGTSNTVSYAYRNQVRAGTGTGTGIFQAALHTPTYQPKNNPDGTPSRQSPFDNLDILLTDVDINTNSLRYIGNVYGDVNITPELKFRSSWSIDYNNYDESEYNTDRTLKGAATKGFAVSALTQNTAWINEQTLAYRKTFGEQHTLGVLIGNTLQSNTLKSTSAQGTGFPNNSYTQISAAGIRTANQSWTKSTLASFFSRVDYNFASKYYLETTLRADASSKFGANNQWGYFPAIGASWRVSEEAFLKNVAVLSDLKLRASYGILGNQNGISNFGARGLWAGGASYPNGVGEADQAGTSPLQLSNPNLRWEKTNQVDAGIDVALFDGRLSFTTDVYYKYTRDLLISKQVPGITGFTNYVTNEGELSNKGIEFSLNTVNIDRNDFTWRTQFNLTRNISKVEKLATPFIYGSRDMVRNEEGYPMYSFWLYKQLYVDAETGNAVFEDRNGDGKITVADRQILGNANPDFFGGLTNNFTYKGFDLGFFFTFQYGNQVVSFDRILNEGGGTKDGNRAIFAYNLRRWQQPGDITDVPRVTSVGSNYGIEQSSRFLEDASFLRLKTLTLGYTPPKSFVSRFGLQSLRVYAVAANLWLLTKYQGPDPEATHTAEQNARGIDVGTPPQPQSFQVGLNITL
jgi:TonB-linked SusC/RagA family outer membrane protein